MKKQVEKKDFIKLLNALSEEGMEGAIPTYIAECVLECKLKHNNNVAMLLNLRKQIDNTISYTYQDRFFYEVLEDEDGKYIKFNSYYFDNGDGLQITEYIGATLSVKELEECGNEREILERIQNFEENAEQSGGECTKKEFFDDIKHRTALPFFKVSQNTPCGFYINV